MATNSYVRVPPDGAGKKVYSKQHTVGSDVVEVQGMHLSDPDTPTYMAHIDQNGALYTRYAEGAPLLAPYGDMKVIQEHILGVYEHTIDSYDDLFYILEQSGGTSTYEHEYSSILMSTTADQYSKVERISNRYHYYQIGTSLMVVITVSMGDSGKSGNHRRWGYSDDDNGVLFELSGTTLNILQRGVAQGDYGNTIRIPQSEWNGDKLDGTGDSGIVLDVTKAYQYFINISWPFGTVEYGIYSSEHGRVKCHENLNDGVFTFPYIKSASLPVYFENENTANTGTGSDMRVISAVVKSESAPDYTFWRFGDLGTGDGKFLSGGTSDVAILSVRPKLLLDDGQRNTINSFPEYLSVYSSDAPVRVKMVWCDDDIFTGATWTLDSVGGPLEGDKDATAIDTEADSYWLTRTFYVQNGTPQNIDLNQYFELNDEGVLLGGGGVNQGVLSFTATSLNGADTTVAMDLSYRGLY